VKQFSLPIKIVTGLGCFAHLPEVVRAYGTKPLLVCGQSALRHSGMLDRALQALQDAGLQVVLYDQARAEPTVDMVQEALDLARRERVDTVIGIGGGSAMDVGKAVAALYKQAGTVREYHSGRTVNERGLPCVCVPTTAGTGTEVTNNAVLTDPQSGIKQSIRGPYLTAAATVVDPELTLNLPPEITAASGADALCQAIEAFVSVLAQPITDALTSQAIQWIGRSLVRACEQGSDIQARSDMLYGSLLTGMAMSHTRLGGAHGLAHSLGYHYHISHGVLCGLLLPYVMEYSLEYAPDRYAQVAQLLGLDTRGAPLHEAAQQAAKAAREITRKVGIPDRLRTFGVRPEDFGQIIQESLPSANLKSNPKLLEAQDLQIILERAW